MTVEFVRTAVGNELRDRHAHFDLGHAGDGDIAGQRLPVGVAVRFIETEMCRGRSGGAAPPARPLPGPRSPYRGSERDNGEYVLHRIT